MSSKKKDKSKASDEKWLLWHKDEMYFPVIFDDIDNIRAELLRGFKDHAYDGLDIDGFVVSKLTGEYPVKFGVSIDVEGDE